MKTLLSIATTLFLCATQTHAQNKIVMKDGTGTHGGNSIGIEFAASAQDALADIERLGERRFPELKVSDLKRLIVSDQVQILVTHEALYVTVNGIQQPVAALSNVNTKTILINEALWKGLQPGLSRKSLALHEYLVLAQVEITGGYQITSRYVSLMSGRPYDLVPICKVHNSTSSGYISIWVANRELLIFQYHIFKSKKKAFEEVMCKVADLQIQKICHGLYIGEIPKGWGGDSYSLNEAARQRLIEYEDLGLPDREVHKPSHCR